jgi:hypothetical protein
MSTFYKAITYWHLPIYKKVQIFNIRITVLTVVIMKDFCLLGHNTVQSTLKVNQLFYKNMSLLVSGLKNKPSKKLAWSKLKEKHALHVPLIDHLTFNGLHGFILQRSELFTWYNILYSTKNWFPVIPLTMQDSHKQEIAALQQFHFMLMENSVQEVVLIL